MYAPRHLPTEGQGNTENWEQLVSFRFKGTALEGGLEEPTLIKEAGVGPWTKPESISAKLEGVTAEVRTELSKAVARMKGLAKTKEALPVGTTLFILPPGFRPLEPARALVVDVTAAAAVYMEITVAGIVNNATEIPIAHFLGFHPVSFPLT